MKILVTGAAGYLGSALSERLLESGHEVRALDNLMYGARPLLAFIGRDGFELVRGDIRNGSLVAGALKGVDGVAHLAAIVGDPACARHPDLCVAVNIEASIALAQAARTAGVRRLVFASSCSSYGITSADGGLATEDHELRPASAYARSKVAVESHLLRLPPAPTTITILRLATLHGLSPRMRFDLTVNGLTADLVTGRRAIVYGEQRFRPYVHVRDAARAIALVLSAPSWVAGGVFNVGSSAENYRKIEVATLIREAVGGGEIAIVSRADDPRDYRVSFERFRERFGYEISRCVRDGAREVAHAIEAGAIDDIEGAGYYNVKTA